MICPSCDASMGLTSRFCPNCGAQLEAPVGPLPSALPPNTGQGLRRPIGYALLAGSAVLLLLFCFHSGSPTATPVGGQSQAQPNLPVDSPVALQASQETPAAHLAENVGSSEAAEEAGSDQKELSSESEGPTCKEFLRNFPLRRCTSGGGKWLREDFGSGEIVAYVLQTSDGLSKLQISCGKDVPFMVMERVAAQLVDYGFGGNRTFTQVFRTEDGSETKFTSGWQASSGAFDRITGKSDVGFTVILQGDESAGETAYRLSRSDIFLPAPGDRSLVFETKGLNLRMFDSDCGSKFPSTDGDQSGSSDNSSADPSTSKQFNSDGLGFLSQPRPEFAEAKSKFEQAVQSDSGNIEALNNLGWIDGRMGDYPTAEDILRKVVAAAPTRRAAQANLGFVLAKEGKVSEATDHLCLYLHLVKSLSTGKAALIKDENDPDPNVHAAVDAAITKCAQ